MFIELASGPNIEVKHSDAKAETQDILSRKILYSNINNLLSSILAAMFWFQILVVIESEILYYL